MTRFFLFILYYVIAFCLGFAVRARYDGWMYAKPICSPGSGFSRRS